MHHRLPLQMKEIGSSADHPRWRWFSQGTSLRIKWIIPMRTLPQSLDQTQTSTWLLIIKDALVLGSSYSQICHMLFSCNLFAITFLFSVHINSLLSLQICASKIEYCFAKLKTEYCFDFFAKFLFALEKTHANKLSKISLKPQEWQFPLTLNWTSIHHKI